MTALERVHQRSQHMARRVGRLHTNVDLVGKLKRMTVTRVVNMGAPLPGITN